MIFESEKTEEENNMAIVRLMHATETSITDKSGSRPTISDASDRGTDSNKVQQNLRKIIKTGALASDDFSRQYSFGKNLSQNVHYDNTQHHSHVSFKPTDYVGSPRHDTKVNEFRHEIKEDEDDECEVEK